MFGSIFIGLSGMNAYSNGLRQISNNITNINSTGFKSSGVVFTDLFGQGAARDTWSGQGVALGDSRIDFTQGELRKTDRDLDLAIDGNGFLVLLKDAEQFFARTGSFEVNKDGDIVLSGTDYKLTVLDGSGNPTPISIDGRRTNPPAATTRVAFAGNLSASTSTFSTPNINVYNAQGDQDVWQVKFDRDPAAPPGEWTVTVTNKAGQTVGDPLNPQKLRFISGGATVDPNSNHLTFADTAGRSVALDFSFNVSSLSGDGDQLHVASTDGHAAGALTTVTIDDTGQLLLTYSNEQKVQLGGVTIATLRDPQTLEQRSGGVFVQRGSGAGVDYTTSAHRTAGRVVAQRLEASNVDLAKEFGELILVQRGFQAASQVVSVSNDMIQQLFGIRGQG